jgi:peroxiredoxin Q/BCP
VRDEIAHYQQLNVRPFGLNPASVEAHAAYAERLKLPFPLLSDPDGSIAVAYHATRPWSRGISRTVYLVGQDGRILFGQRGAPGPELSLAPLWERAGE